MQIDKTNKIFSSGRALSKFHEGGGRMLYLAVGNIAANTST